MDKMMIINCAADTSMHEGVPQRFADSEVLADSVARIGHELGRDPATVAGAKKILGWTRL